MIAGPRPTRLVLVAGTGTEVGKTWVGAGLARHLRAHGRTVAARKPAQSFDPDDRTTDADLLADATGEAPDAVCPPHRWYPVALAPPMAAEVLDRPAIHLADLLAELTWPAPAVDVGLVEAAGGVRSPLAVDGDTVGLAAALHPDLTIVVGDAGLGTINAVRLTTAALGDALGDRDVVTLLNRFDPGDDLHRRNAAWLRDEGLAVATSLDELAAAAAGGR